MPSAPERNGWSYAKAGVDVRAKDDVAKRLAAALAFQRVGRGAPVGGIGHFAGLVDFGPEYLVLCTDGVGTKLEVANALRKWDTVGIDCIAMNVNDAICVGAEPIAFVDYLAVESPDPGMAEEIGRGLAEGAREANVSIVGGETAVLPTIVRGFDLAGTCLGVVARNEVIDGSAIEAGDVIVGLPSSGIHSNGLTLARRVFSEAGIGYDKEIRPGLRLGPALLEPTRIYVRPLLELLRRLRPPATPPIGRGNAAETRAGAVHGIAHITGSGILNLPRLKAGLRYRIEEPLAPPPIFAAIEEVGNVEKAEMYRTFNMGMGLAIVLAADAAEDAIRSLSPHFPARVVGRVLEGKTGADVPSAGVSLDGAKF